MTDANKPNPDAEDVKPDALEGEGSYTAAKDYQDSVRGFMAEHKDEIEPKAREAKEALEGEEGRDLLNAEASAQAHSRAKHTEK